jgi:hypothetical protein
MVHIKLCGIYSIVGFPEIQSFAIMLYDYKNNYRVDNAMHSGENGGRKRNKEEKEMRKQLD